MSDKDGGQAFPATASGELWEDRDGSNRLSFDLSGGMSLRDYFAGQALAGITASPNLDRSKPAPELARNCYSIADAMLDERAKV